MEHYFETNLNIPSGSNLIQWLADDWARRLSSGSALGLHEILDNGQGYVLHRLSENIEHSTFPCCHANETSSPER